MRSTNSLSSMKGLSMLLIMISPQYGHSPATRSSSSACTMSCLEGSALPTLVPTLSLSPLPSLPRAATRARSCQLAGPRLSQVRQQGLHQAVPVESVAAGEVLEGSGEEWRHAGTAHTVPPHHGEVASGQGYLLPDGGGGGRSLRHLGIQLVYV